MKMVIAEMQTRNFVFRAVGTDSTHAAEVLVAAWRKHASQYHVAPLTFEELSEEYDIDFTTIQPGYADRDRQSLDIG